MRKCYNSANYYNFTNVYNNYISLSSAFYPPKEVEKTLADTILYLSYSSSPYLPFSLAPYMLTDTIRYWKDTYICNFDHIMGREMDSIFYDPKEYYDFTYVRENHDYSIKLMAGVFGATAIVSYLIFIGLVAATGFNIEATPESNVLPLLILIATMPTACTMKYAYYDYVTYATDTLMGLVEEPPITDPNTDWI